MKKTKVLSLPVVARSCTDVAKLTEEGKEVRRHIDSCLESGYKIEATHSIVLGEVAYLIYSLVKEA